MIALAALAGCGGPETIGAPPRDAAPDEEPPISQVGRGGTARVVLPPPEPACFNPYLARCAGAEVLNGTTLEGPLAAGPGERYVPLLAEEVPAYETGTLGLEPFTVEFRLRTDAAYADGTPLTSADVRRTYEGAARLARSGEIAPAYSGFGRLLRVETPDDRTARLVFDEPHAAWRDLLTAPILAEAPDNTPPDEAPVGSGPFLHDDPEGGTSFAANPRYWASDPTRPLPTLDALEVTFEDSGGVAAALREDRADFGFFTSPETMPGSGDLFRAAAARTRTEVLLLDARSVGDEGLRRSMVRAVDRERAAAVAGVEAVRGFHAPPAPAEEPESGGALRLVYPEGGAARAAVADAVAADLTAAGFEVEARSVAAGEFFAELLPEGGFDLALYDAGTPAGYAAALPALPSGSGEDLEQALGDPDTGGSSLLASAGGTSLMPLFVWPDAYAWSGTLYGPRPETPLRGTLWNVREWGFYR